MAVLFLCTFALQAISGIAVTERDWRRRLNSCTTPPPLDFIIGIDASKSMTSGGWEAAVRFANGLIDYVLQDNNQKKGAVRLYYFNGLLVVRHDWIVCLLDGDCDLRLPVLQFR